MANILVVKVTGDEIGDDSFFVLARSQVIYYVLNIGVFHPYQHVKHYNIDYAARRNIECF